jgi:hypothetical protein
MDTGPATKMSDEEHVKVHALKWLNEELTSKDVSGDGNKTETIEEGLPRFTLVIPEYQVADGRLDFVAARWKSDYQLDIVGVECKGRTNPASLWSITSGQLSRYLKLVPKLYFACISPEQAAALKEYEALCRVAKVGLSDCPRVGSMTIASPWTRCPTHPIRRVLSSMKTTICDRHAQES